MFFDELTTNIKNIILQLLRSYRRKFGKRVLINFKHQEISIDEGNVGGFHRLKFIIGKAHCTILI